jgi:hypothetical protein
MNVQFYREGGCDTDHYLLTAKLREMFSINRQNSYLIWRNLI